MSKSFNIVKRNLYLDSVVYNLFSKISVLVLRYNIGDKGFITGDIDILSLVDIETLKLEINDSMPDNVKSVWFVDSLNSYNCVLYLDDYLGVIRLDIHINEKWKWIQTIPKDSLIKTSYTHDYGFMHISCQNKVWLEICFNFFNNNYEYSLPLNTNLSGQSFINKSILNIMTKFFLTDSNLFRFFLRVFVIITLSFYQAITSPLMMLENLQNYFIYLISTRRSRHQNTIDRNFFLNEIYLRGLSLNNYPLEIFSNLNDKTVDSAQIISDYQYTLKKIINFYEKK